MNTTTTRILTLAATLALGITGVAIAIPPAASSPQQQPAAVQLTKAQSDFFEQKVRPVLVQNCYRCHSIEEGKAKGGLTLDTREGLKKGGENGPAIVAGDPAKSKLIVAISYKDADLQMPPKGEKLTDQQIADLTQWVRMGAPDPRTAGPGAGQKLTGLNDKAKAHWAYQPVKRQAVPAVKDAAWVKSPIDAFVLSKLEASGMQPNAPAPKELLIRRATYDLIGLPPTPEEVEAFVNDTSPNAYEKVIDRLLASPHYGERWGRFWLDSARYSDTSGEEKLRKEDYRYAFAWTYRDYVIKAFNEDKPYDKFLMEQIAADQMPSTSQDPSRLAALGFLTVGKRFQNPNDQIDERIDAMTKSTMALTVACARCHDHKFDPIPQADYYALHGIFASTFEPADKPLVGKPIDGPEYQDFLKQMSALEQKNREIYYEIIAEKSGEFRHQASAYLQVALLGRGNKGGVKEEKERNELIRENKLDDDLFRTLRQGFQGAQPVFAPLIRFAQLSESEITGMPGQRLMEEIAMGHIGPRPVNPIVARAFKESPAPKSLKDVCDVYGKLFAEVAPKATEYLNACRTTTGKEVSGYEPALVSIINFPSPIEPAGWLDTDHLKAILQTLPIKNGNAYQRFTFPAINELELTHPGAPGRAMVVADSPNPKNSPIFIRGEAQNRGPIVPRHFLSILTGGNPPAFTHGSGRLELAMSIADRRNPLTARVAINRIWMHHFGEGFVRTPDDLGVQSEPPSHPELLDYLAGRFVDDGWSFKKMHKLIMLSSTYQQSSENKVEYAQKDPANRLLWRQNLRRLDFEAIRDSMLQLTGKMDSAVYGKPVNLTDEPYSNRRSVYGYIDRGELPELMAQFDFSDPDMANSKRTSTIVPQQALFFMNSPMAVDVARKVTTRPEFVAAKDDSERVRTIYRVMFQRDPRQEEVNYALEFIQSNDDDDDNGPTPLADGNGKFPGNRRFANGKPFNPKFNAGKKGGGRAPIQNKGEYVERKPLTAWELYAQALLFTNEFAYVN